MIIMITASKAGDGAVDQSADFTERLVDTFRTYNETLVGYLALRLSSRQEASEVAQEAYLRLMNLADPDKIMDIRSFLFRTANNIAIDRIRHQRMRLRVLERVAAGDVDAEPLTSGPEDEIAARQGLQLLRNAIEELPPKCRMAFILYKLQGHSYTDIALRMNLTESMVRKYVLRGLQYCRRRLDQQLGV
jgi:RNA polymerase sigma factor (sigma-70 family)